MKAREMCVTERSCRYYDYIASAVGARNMNTEH
jgi:hypothetical protein